MLTMCVRFPFQAAFPKTWATLAARRSVSVPVSLLSFQELVPLAPATQAPWNMVPQALLDVRSKGKMQSEAEAPGNPIDFGGRVNTQA